MNQIKTCATCRHLTVLEQGREFEMILDTEYTLFQCAVLKWEKKEFYLMAPVEKELRCMDDDVCDYWEYWKEDDKSGKSIG